MRNYDTDPGRYRLAMRLTAAHRAPEANLHARIVRVLDIGCGDGVLGHHGTVPRIHRGGGRSA